MAGGERRAEGGGRVRTFIARRAYFVGRLSGGSRYRFAGCTIAPMHESYLS